MQIYLEEYVERERKRALLKSEADINTVAMLAALADCKKKGIHTLILEPKTYCFRAMEATEKMIVASNNDSGVKKVLVDLSGMAGLTIDGQGAVLLFQDRILPIYVKESRDITIQNLFIDYVYPFYLQGKITGVGDSYLDLEIDRDRFPYVVEHETLFYRTEGYATSQFYNVLEVNAKSGLVETKKGDDWGNMDKAVQLDEGHIRIYKKFEKPHTVGNYVILQIENREYPAIIMDSSQKITLRQVTVWQSYSMALLAQKSRDIQVYDCRVGRKEKDARLISASADALHFVNCSGRVVVDHCAFSHQMDDAVNCHGIYMQITEVSGRKLIAEAKHPQQYQVDIFEDGDMAAFLEQRTLKSIGGGCIENWARLDEKRIEVLLQESNPKLKPGDLIENQERMPELLISNCTIGNMRARGVLVTTPKDAEICHNYFHTSGSAVLVEGDGNFWYESGAVNHLHIHDNEFADCCYSECPTWGEAVIQVSPKVFGRSEADGFYHKHMCVEHNRFRVKDAALIKAFQVEDIQWKCNYVEDNNTI
ncbi:MAG: hypothetical protein PHS82_00540 [Lachnospiraceae bacterium]|nr:hypothetical protein [Lachnospiraceae bacterium]